MILRPEKIVCRGPGGGCLLTDMLGFRTTRGRVADLEARVATLETDFKRIRVEWDEVYDKIVRGRERARKRERDAAAAEINGEAPGAIAVPATPGELSLPPRVAARRRMNGA